MNYPDDLRAVAKRVVWFKTPEEALEYPKVFLAHVMTYGTLDDLVSATKYYSEPTLRLFLMTRRLGYLIDARGTTGIYGTSVSRFHPCHDGAFQAWSQVGLRE